MLNSASSKRRDGEKIRRLAARQSLDQRKRRLSVALGVVSTGEVSSRAACYFNL